MRYILGATVSTNMFEDVRFSCVIVFGSPSSSITVILNVAYSSTTRSDGTVSDLQIWNCIIV